MYTQVADLFRATLLGPHHSRSLESAEAYQFWQGWSGPGNSTVTCPGQGAGQSSTKLSSVVGYVVKARHTHHMQTCNNHLLRVWAAYLAEGRV